MLLINTMYTATGALSPTMPPHHPSIKWWDFVPNVEVLERANLVSIEAMLIKNHL